MEILKKLNASKLELDTLGAKRETSSEQRSYLLEMSMRFQSVVTMALSANYAGNDWFDSTPSLRLATSVVNRNDAFASTIERYGHAYTFGATENKGNVMPQPPFPEGKEELVILRSTVDQPDLMELPAQEGKTSIKIGTNILNWLTGVYKQSRGFELGTFDSSILAETMKMQSCRWEAIATCYMLDVISMTHVFIKDLLNLVCPDRHTREGIISILMDPLMAKYRNALDHANFLLHVERKGTPTTMNHYFNDNLEKRQVPSLAPCISPS